MVVKVQDTEEILRGALDRWKAGIDAEEPERVAEVFTGDAIFQGLHPYSVGRQGVIDYYASQPRGMMSPTKCSKLVGPQWDWCWVTSAQSSRSRTGPRSA